MALIQCRKCGGEVSDKAKACPHCGELLTDGAAENLLEERSPIICEECGNKIPEGTKACPKCGCPIYTADVDDKPIHETVSTNSSNGKKKTITIITVAVLAIVAIMGFIIIRNNVLFGDDRIAYEMIMDVADNFKDPSSVRLVSGELGVDKDCMFCGISANNGWGNRTTSYYFIMGGMIMKEDDPTSLYMGKDELNFEKINKNLERALERFY